MSAFRLLAPLVAVVGLAAAVSARDPEPEFLAFTSANYSSPLAVQLDFHASVRKAVPRHEYRFLYQIRLHTKTGEAGPVLGDAERPNGRATDLGAFPPADPGLIQFFMASADVTRKELSGMTGLPKDARDVILRVEPQIYDATDKRFLTPPKSNALLLFVQTDKGGRVWDIQTFSEWFPNQFGSEANAKKGVRVLTEVDAWDQTDFGFVTAFEKVFGSKTMKPALKVIALRAMPAKLYGGKNSLHSLFEAMEKEGDAELTAAVEAKRAEALKQ